MSESDKEEDPSSVSSVPGLLSDLNDNSSNETAYKYRDFSHVGIDDDAELAAENPPPSQAARGNSESSIRVQKFPVKLYAILAQKEFQDIITWMPHGRSWKVLKPNLFESMVMPLFFEYSNYHSFNRLVNAWSFRRVSSGPDRGSYYHELFLRGMPHLQKYMRRLPKTHKKLPMSKKDEPDFYALDKTNPLPPIEAAPVPGAAATTAAVRNSQQYQQQNNGMGQHSSMGVSHPYMGQHHPPQPRGMPGQMAPHQPRYMRHHDGPGHLVEEYYDGNSLAAPAYGTMNVGAGSMGGGYNSVGGGYGGPPQRSVPMRGGPSPGHNSYNPPPPPPPMEPMLPHQAYGSPHQQPPTDSMHAYGGNQMAGPTAQSTNNYHYQQQGYSTGFDGSAAAAGSLVGIRASDHGDMVRRPVARRPAYGE